MAEFAKDGLNIKKVSINFMMKQMITQKVLPKRLKKEQLNLV